MMLRMYLYVSTNQASIGRSIHFVLFRCFLSSLHPIADPSRAPSLPSRPSSFIPSLLPFLFCRVVSILYCAVLSFPLSLLCICPLFFFAFLFSFLSSKTRNKETKLLKRNKRNERNETAGTAEMSELKQNLPAR